MGQTHLKKVVKHTRMKAAKHIRDAQQDKWDSAMNFETPDRKH
jgi:hypothetical protein